MSLPASDKKQTFSAKADPTEPDNVDFVRDALAAILYGDSLRRFFTAILYGGNELRVWS